MSYPQRISFQPSMGNCFQRRRLAFFSVPDEVFVEVLAGGGVLGGGGGSGDFEQGRVSF